MKKVSGVIHLWLGMISGLIVFIVSITGCIFVFEQEAAKDQERNRYDFSFEIGDLVNTGKF